MSAPDKLPPLLYATVSVDNSTRYAGYHRELFTRSFSILEEALVICTLCQGVKRDACIFRGITACKLCSHNPDKATPVMDIRDLVNRLFMKCPLASRGCNWTGNASDGESHLQRCKELLGKCPNKCEVGVNRRTMEEHGKVCSMRVLPCDHCGEEMRAKNLESHLLTCDMRPVSCPNCKTDLKRREEAEHLKKCPVISGREPPQTQNVVAARVVKAPEDVAEATRSEGYLELERETACLKERVSCLERKNQILTRAVFSKPELVTYDATTGRILEGFEWRMVDATRLTSSVSTSGSPSFYIRHHNLRITADAGVMGSVALSVTRVQGCHDEIVRESCLTYFRCELVPVGEGQPLELSARIKHRLELDSRSAPFLFMDLSTLRDPLYLRDDSLCMHVYFDTAPLPL